MSINTGASANIRSGGNVFSSSAIAPGSQAANMARSAEMADQKVFQQVLSAKRIGFWIIVRQV